MTRTAPAAAGKFAPSALARPSIEARGEWWRGEGCLTLEEARLAAPGDPKPSYLTVWNWKRRGIKGWKLQVFHQGGRVYTTREAMTRFFRAIETGPAPLPPPDGIDPASPRDDPQVSHPVPPRTLGERVERMNEGLGQIFETGDPPAGAAPGGKRRRRRPAAR